MQSRPALASLLLSFALTAGQALGQSGLRVPLQAEPGLDPAFAGGWLGPDYDRFGFALNNWRETVGFAPGQRMNWTYSLTERSALGMGYGNSRDPLEEQRQLSLYGRYSFAQDWALSAETLGRDASGLFRLQDFRIGVQRRF